MNCTAERSRQYKRRQNTAGFGTIRAQVQGGVLEKERLDILVQRQAEVTRSKAQGLIQTGQVYSPEGEKLDKPGQRLATDTALDIRAQARFVSRGGDKLEGAMVAFAPDVAGRICMDVGASTGGFTDCLLQHGAAKVYAVDVGYGQLAWSLRQDPRVVVLERVNSRHLKPEQLDELPTFFTADCSFISLRTVLPPLLALVAPGAEGIVLIKPQFEAGPENVGKGGVVRDAKIRAAVVEDLQEFVSTLGFASVNVIESPLRGPAGNFEYLAFLSDWKTTARHEIAGAP